MANFYGKCNIPYMEGMGYEPMLQYTDSKASNIPYEPSFWADVLPSGKGILSKTPAPGCIETSHTETLKIWRDFDGSFSFVHSSSGRSQST